MIEIIYNESGKKGGSVIIKPPKNIRQIGSPRGRHKIYMEDYVYTFLHSSVFENNTQKRAAVLLGKSEVSQEIRYTFISGAISCEDFVFQEENIVFDESCWEYIYKEIKQYFDSHEVVGWFLGMPGFPLEITPAMEAAHRKYFTGREKVLFLSEPSEGEDTFYAYEQGILQKKEGYYVYYEKNLSMQEYMVCTREKAREKSLGIEERIRLPLEDFSHDIIVDSTLEKGDEQQKGYEHQKEDKIRKEGELRKEEKRQKESRQQEDKLHSEARQQQEELQGKDQPKEKEEQEQDTGNEKEVFAGIEREESKSEVDQALQSYRSMLLEKKENGGQKKMSVFLYTASAAAMIVLCVIGITTLNNYEKMKQVEETLSMLSQSAEENYEKDESEPAGLVVESVPGEIEPEDNNQDKDQKNNVDIADNAGNTDNDAGVKGNTVNAGNGDNGTNTENADNTGDQEAQAMNQENEQEAETKDEGNDGNTENEQESPNDSQKETGDTSQEETKDTSQEESKDTSQESIRTSAQVYLEQGYYIVQPGDKLEAICRSIYQTAAMMDKLREVNGIEDADKIYVGQKIILP